MRPPLKWLLLLLAVGLPLVPRWAGAVGVPPALSQAAPNQAQQAEADRLLQQGIEQYQVSQFREALQSWEQALAIYREIGDREGEAQTLNNIGIIYESFGNYGEALNYSQQSLIISREISDRATEALSLNRIGTVSRDLGKYSTALEYYQQSLTIMRELGDLDGEAGLLNNIGIVHRLLGDYPTALEYYQQSLTITRNIGDYSLEADNLGNIGSIYGLSGNYPTALEYYQQSLTITRNIGDYAAEADSLNNIGNIYGLSGNYLLALENYQQSLEIARNMSNIAGEAIILGNMGEVYRNIGNYAQALRHYEQSLMVKQAIGDREGEAITVGNLGIIYDDSGDYLTALDYYEQSLAISRDINDAAGEAQMVSNIGVIYEKIGNYSQALEYYMQSLTMQREIGDRATEANTLKNIGNANRFLGSYPTALDYYQQSLIIAREIGDRATEAKTLGSLGFTYLNLNRLPDAESVFLDAVTVLETLRDIDFSDADKISFLETQTQTYKGLEQTYILQGKPEAALEISERGRSRAFVDLLVERLSVRPVESLSSESPGFAKIQQIAQQNQSVLVEYSLVDGGAEGLDIYIWVVQPTGQLDFRKVSLDDETLDLSSLVTGSREAMGVRQRGGFDLAVNQPTEADQLRKLHQLLIEPIADLLPSNPEQRIVFIPQGDLFLVPFPALLDAAGTYLIEKHTILTAPSIQVLDLSQQQRQTQNFATALTGQDLLLVGNPTMPEVWNPATSKMQTLSNLPGAELEAEEIATFFDTTPLLGGNATETAVKERIGNARIVHLATHGLLEYGSPQDSGVSDVPGAIALAPGGGEDGLLTSAEILAELDLNAELVVLSACDTGLGQITGDGVIGLSRALITAGTPSVIVSLWSVPDAPTAELMTEFYSQMQQGQDKAQALRQAMLATMQTNPDPRDWAAFTLIGAAE